MVGYRSHRQGCLKMTDNQTETTTQDNDETETDVIGVLSMDATRDELMQVIRFAVGLAPVETLEVMGKEVENNMMGSIAESYTALSELTTKVDESSIDPEDAQKEITNILVSHCEAIDLHTGLMSVIVTALNSRLSEDEDETEEVVSDDTSE